MTETMLVDRTNKPGILIDGLISLLVVIVCFSIVLESKPVRRYCNYVNPFCRCPTYNNGCYEYPASCSSGILVNASDNAGNDSSLTTKLDHSNFFFNFNPGALPSVNESSLTNTTEHSTFHAGEHPSVTVGVSILSTTSDPAGTSGGTSRSDEGGDLVCPLLAADCVPSMIAFDANDCPYCSVTGEVDHARPSLNHNGCPPVTYGQNLMTDCHIDRNGCLLCLGSFENTTPPQTTTTPTSTPTTITPRTTIHTTTSMITTTPTIIMQTARTPKTTPLDTTTRARGNNYCLQCDGTVSPHTCSHVTKCGNTESCFIDSFVNSMGGIRYRLGCRDTHQCGKSGKRDLSSNTVNRHTHSAQEMHLRRGTSVLPDDTVADDTGTSVVCSQCCNESLCNTGGCGAIPYPELRLGSRGPMCFTCSQQSRMDDCDTVRLCGRNQMCKLEQISISDIVLWTTSCEDASTYQVLMNSAGSNCISTCCASDLCNHECPAKCPILRCQLDCGNPPKYKKDINGCDICVCDTTSGTHVLIG